MEEKNELNDIILNKGGSAAGSKKIILAVATLGVILIIVVMLMNTLTSTGTDNLPQAILPPDPQTKQEIADEEPLFEEVQVVQESNQNNDSLDKIAQKLKAESNKEKTESAITQEAPKEAPKAAVKTAVKKVAPKSVTKPETTATATTGSYYIQVGSFARYEPNKKFLDSILRLGYKYKFHQVTNNGKTLNKVLVGPFPSEGEAREALRSVRTSIEAGAFLTKI
ncbi:MAG: SPOR domain-containing protein [Sulfurimonas sp.]|uniref:SPOR domain-containing protein n=1 Tax=Sulfurimonas sp. TaxID=2022749 RepID=UPI0026308D31|nr:SPOR domain-containing protein [Sulfurimonas sp.]MCW8894322.1 SPOR domain-containing protein [Sulfurimonas sp.]MCW8954889.1 SPOR domain-containing protein [Sulfurimonas sp.]MCW9067863.1 SPOR domain-containing protein [Sulfurimonas sp.]